MLQNSPFLEENAHAIDNHKNLVYNKKHKGYTKTNTKDKHMRRLNYKVLALSLPVLGSVLASPATFATGISDYNINYSGGTKLSSNVVEKSNILNNLTPLITDKVTTSFTNSTSVSWREAYYKSNNTSCKKTHYVVVKDTNQIADNGPSFTLTSESGYSLDVTIKSITTDNTIDTVVGVIDDTSAVHVGEPLYNTDQCAENDYAVIDGQLLVKNDKRVFVDMIGTLKKDGNVFNHDGVYFGITDIDAAQSYKIMGSSQFVANEMITPSKSILDDNAVYPTPPQGTTINLDNYFVTSQNGNYIYSQFATSPDNGYWLQNSNGVKSAVYSPVQKSDLSNLNFIFGFAKGAGSQIRLYVKQLNVNYISDDNGTITGIDAEKVFIDGNPSGSKTKPSDGYTLSYWVADKDVIRCIGGSCGVIKAGEPIADEYITSLTLTDDTTFKAIHEKKPKAPDTSEVISKELGGAVVPASITGAIILAIVLFYLPRVNRKKVNFKKK